MCVSSELDSDPDEVCVDADEEGGELRRRLRLEEKRVDVVVLDEVAGSGADHVEGIRDDGRRLAAGQLGKSRLVFPEVLQLLR